MDLSCFDTPIRPGPAEFHLGYASITWGGDDRQAIDDISALGFPGIQLRSNVIAAFEAAALKELLQKRHLTFVALSSGAARVDSGSEAEDIAKHVANAKYLHHAGGLYLHVSDQHPKHRNPPAG